VVDAASRGEPQVVTRRGVETAVVISYRDYERIAAARRVRTPTLAAYLLSIPTTPAEGAIERIPLDARDVAF
jgi:prevent-host-death family protein